MGNERAIRAHCTADGDAVAPFYALLPNDSLHYHSLRVDIVTHDGCYPKNLHRPLPHALPVRGSGLNASMSVSPDTRNFSNDFPWKRHVCMIPRSRK
jgi:hypothetical protein